MSAKPTLHLVSAALLIWMQLGGTNRAQAQPSARFSNATEGRGADESSRELPNAEARGRNADSPSPSPQAPRPNPGTRCARVSFPLSQARRMVSRGDYLNALSKYTQVVMLEGRCGNALLELARLREALGDIPEAERLYRRAARLRDSAPEALRSRARLRRRQGRTLDAFQDLRAAAQLDPSHLATLRTLADWYIEARAWAAALAQYRAIVRVLSSKPEAAGLEQARIKARALAALAADTDPVSNGKLESNWVRRSLSQLAVP